MPAKKAKKAEDEESVIEEAETVQEQCGKMIADLAENVDKRFSKLESTIEKYFTAGAAARDPRPEEPSATATQVNPHDTRNKGLRKKYNPTMTSTSYKVGQQEENRAQHQRELDENADMDVTQDAQWRNTAHAQLPLQDVNIRPGPSHQASGQGSAWPPTYERDLSMNKWLLDNATGPNGASLLPLNPMSGREFHNNDALDRQVQEILANTSTAIARGKVKTGVFPFKYITRGVEKRPTTFNTLNLAEHLYGIFRIIRDPEVPNDIKPSLLTHIEQVLEDAIDYDWAGAVRPWSDEVFSRIAEGRIHGGWMATMQIQNLRMTMAQASTARIGVNMSTAQGAKQSQPTSTRFKQSQAPPTSDPLRGGPPCMAFNSQQGCQLPSGHIANGQKLCHICAFCLFNAATPRPHSEFYCRNKNRAHHF